MMALRCSYWVDLKLEKNLLQPANRYRNVEPYAACLVSAGGTEHIEMLKMGTVRFCARGGCAYARMCAACVEDPGGWTRPT